MSLLHDLPTEGKLIKLLPLAVSMLPLAYHPLVAKQCISSRVNLVTSSYQSPAMKELQSR